MIGLRELTAGIAEYLAVNTGMVATNCRAESPVYPCLLVEGESKSAGIAACGKQVERQVTVTVTCYPSRRREREEGLALADRVYGLLTAGFTACDRGFCPKEAESFIDQQERAKVRLLLEFYDLPEAPENPSTATERMGTLTLKVGHSEEGR